MSNISEHDPEKKRKSYYCKKWGVCFLISCDSISFYNLLSWSCEIVDGIMSWILACWTIYKLTCRQVQLSLKSRQNILQSLYIFISNINISLEKIVKKSHFIQSAIQLFFLQEIKFQILMSLEKLAFRHSLSEFL